jgi:hypothetical protein
MAVTASMSQSMISQSLIRGKDKRRNANKKDSEDDSDDFDDDDDDEVEMDRYEDEVVRDRERPRRVS